MTKYFSKFSFAEKFDSLPDRVGIDGRGNLRLDRTKVDMIPAGLKGIFFVFCGKKPRYIAPDFRGWVLYYNSKGLIEDMDILEVKAAKARYNVYRDLVEKPRYIKEDDGSLSLCSLPRDMHVFQKRFESGYHLDLTRTSVRSAQNLDDFKSIVLYPKKPVQQELPFTFAQKIIGHKGCQRSNQKQSTKE